jgi:diguanylate cyclase (GGDEF)-like protein
VLERIQLTPAARLAIGLASLTVCLFLMLDFALGLTPDRGDIARRVRQATAESLASQVAVVLPTNDRKALIKLLADVQARVPDMRSAAVRMRNGQVVASTGAHVQNWVAPADGRSTLTHMQLPLHTGKELWGNVEIAFDPVYPEGLLTWLREPAILALMCLSMIGALCYYLYLRRALQYLDPTSAVPERVRAAFDTLTEGLLVLDIRGRVVLANHAFRRLEPRDVGAITGKQASELRWLTKSLDADSRAHPWTRALAENTSVEDETFSIEVEGFEDPRRFVVKANPITDGSGAKRGCLVTFDDVTRLHEMNQMMRHTLEELRASRAQVEQKNEELQRLASRDPLTGCLNRRSFFDQLTKMRAAASAAGETLAFVMCDVDHFKSFNDRFGHAVGDQVLQTMSQLLARGTREGDLLCRLGGEEFCVALSGMTMPQVMARADALRLSIEREAGALLNIVQDLKVTASFGVACLPATSIDPAQLLDLADQALYSAKRRGRNRVVSWPFEDVEAEQSVAEAA